MKQFTVTTAVLSVSIMAFWMILQPYSASPSGVKNDNLAVQAQEGRNQTLKAGNAKEVVVPVTAAHAKIAPVFDTTGAVISNPSGIKLNANPSDVKIAPVYDANGVVVSDPSGAIFNSYNP